MKQATLSRKILVWYRFAKRRSRRIRALSLMLLSVALITSRAVEVATKLGGSDRC
jgi:hypothetical protein